MSDDWTDLFPEPEEPIAPKKKPWEILPDDDGQNLVVMIDGDIVAYRAAAPCDGSYYEHKKLPDRYRYKKDIVAALKAAKLPAPELDSIEFGKEPEPEGYATYNVDRIMEGIMNHFSDEEYCIKVFLTGNQNFRQELNTEYKANRSDSAKPVHLNACKQHLANRYHAHIEDHLEADDLLGINQMRYAEEGRESVICSIDKDLLCIPGRHYNFVKQQDLEMHPLDALRHFYTQVLTGDTTDNIPGIKGIGPKKAEKIIGKLSAEDEIYTAVFKAWAGYLYPDGVKCEDNLRDVRDTIQASAQLLWILQEDGVLWTPPFDPVEKSELFTGE